MVDPSPINVPLETPSSERLDSWKEIAAYLHRDVTTVQRWEKREGMPVHRHLHDKRGSVYALAPELDAWRHNRKPHLDEENAESEAAPETAADGQPRTRRDVGWWAAAAGLAAIGLAVMAAIAYGGHWRSTAAPKIRSLAVLPLKNLSGDPTQDYLADGMTEELIGRLSKIRDLRVISHTSVMRFKNPQESVSQIARALGADAIVEGSVRRDGNRIRVTAQLIRGDTDGHFWSETYDRELRDALELESAMAQAIAEKVEVTVTGVERDRLVATRPVAPEVYESYLKGRFALTYGNSRKDVEASANDFEGAIKMDPTFAPAYVGLASAVNRLGTVFMGGSPAQTRPKLIGAARKALELDPNIAEAHVMLANVEQEQWHWADSEAEYRRALDLSPNDAGAHAGFALWLLCEGRTDEAVVRIQHGRDLDPAAVPGALVGWILFQARHYDESLRVLRGVIGGQPNDANALWDLGFVLAADNQPADAIAPLEKALSVTQGSSAVMGVLIRAYAHAGRRDDALRLLAELNRRKSTGYVPSGAFVNAYLGLGENEKAFASLEQAYREQSNILQFVKVHPYFDSIRADPRFADLVRRVGLE